MGKDPAGTGILVRTIGGVKTGKRVRSAKLVNFGIEDFPYASKAVPRPDEQKPVNYGSDSEPEENGIMVNDGDEIKDNSGG
jgi:hypothetical protein